MESGVISRQIDLNPEDWLWATWRPRTPWQRSEPEPFDLDRALQQAKDLDESREPQTFYTRIVSKPLTHEAAHFWFFVICNYPFRLSYEEFVKILRQKDFTEPVSLDEARDAILNSSYKTYLIEVLNPLIILLPLESLVELLLEVKGHASQWFREVVFPYLTNAEVEGLHQVLRPRLNPGHWPQFVQYNFSGTPYYLAAILGMHTEIQELVESWPDNLYADKSSWHFRYYSQVHEVTFGLGSADLVEFHMRRLQLTLYFPLYVRAWLAHTEYSALDWVSYSIQKLKDQTKRDGLVEVLTLVKAPEAASPLLESTLNQACPAALNWLENHLQLAIPGLLPITTQTSKLGEAAVQFLQRMHRRGHGDLIQSYLNSQGLGLSDSATDQPVLQKIQAKLQLQLYPVLDSVTMPEDLKTALAQVRTRSKITWVSAADLPIIPVNGYQLNGYQLSNEQVNRLVLAIRQGNANHPFVVALKKYCQPQILDQFAWELFQRWLQVGAPSKDKWALMAIGYLGTDASVLKLAPLIKNWPGEGQHKRAVSGLECLEQIGTDTALMQIHQISRKVKYKGLRTKAQDCIQSIAEKRELTLEQLEDRIVADCGLDAQGSRIFDYGSQKFHLVIDENLKPKIRDQSGKMRANLPKPKADDSPEQAQQEMEAWKLFKKQWSETIKTQSRRLENAMINTRIWSQSEFKTYLVDHPVLHYLVRSLVWAGYDTDETLRATFRLTEDRTYADVVDEDFDLDKISKVGVLHPAQVSTDLRHQWGEVLSDYEIIPPFRQLSRTIFSLTPEELQAKEITRFQSQHVPLNIMGGILDSTGWQRSETYYKPFPRIHLSAVLLGSMGNIVYRYDDLEVITSCFFVPGLEPKGKQDIGAAVPLANIDPVVLSEVLRTLGAIASKAE